MGSSGELAWRNPHVLVVSFPTQGHFNPLLQFSKRLVSKRLMVTIVTTEESRERMSRAQDAVPDGLNSSVEVQLETISDGFPLDFDRSTNADAFLDMLRRMGKLSLANLIERLTAQGNNISCIVYDSFLPWVLEVAKKFNIPVAFFWTQSCAVYSIYYNYTRGLANWRDETGKETDAIEIPGLPLLNVSDMPSFLLPSSPHDKMRLLVMEQFKTFSEATWILGNSFDELESEEIKSMKPIAPIRTVGPLLPSAFLEGGNAGDTDCGAHMWKTTNCMDWLNTKKPASVVYVSFGSIVVLSKEQVHEMALGLKASGYSFIWVIRPPLSEKGTHTEENLPEGFLDEISEQGLIVPWCHQLKVLSHASVGAFLTHCGWNSTLESLSLGVPMLMLPQWGDQTTIAEKWKTGLRLNSENGLVGKEEVEKCIRRVMESPLGVELRKNALQWKKLSREAMMKGGSSDQNIQTFVEEIIGRAGISSMSGPRFTV